MLQEPGTVRLLAIKPSEQEPESLTSGQVWLFTLIILTSINEGTKIIIAFDLWKIIRGFWHWFGYRRRDSDSTRKLSLRPRWKSCSRQIENEDNVKIIFLRSPMNLLSVYPFICEYTCLCILLSIRCLIISKFFLLNTYNEGHNSAYSALTSWD